MWQNSLMNKTLLKGCQKKANFNVLSILHNLFSLWAHLIPQASTLQFVYIHK